METNREVNRGVTYFIVLITAAGEYDITCLIAISTDY